MSDEFDMDGFEEEEEEGEEEEDLDQLSDEEILAKAKSDAKKAKKAKAVKKKLVKKKKAPELPEEEDDEEEVVEGPVAKDVPEEVPRLLGDGGFYQLASKLDKDCFVTQEGKTVLVIEALRTACNQIDALFRVKFEELNKAVKKDGVVK